MARYPIELGVVFRDRDWLSCKENVSRNVRYLIELRVVRSLLEGFRGIQLS